MPGVGEQFAGYRIDSVLGRGGMGVVYLARDLSLDRSVALKVLPPELAHEEGFRERFVRESRLAASLDHPAIVTVYEAREHEELMYISMHYVPGRDLAALIDSEGALTPGRAVALLDQVASALDAAHDRGLVHRDVKPRNILVTPPQGRRARELAYLCDFGLTKSLASKSHITKTGTTVGTLDYMAPEQFGEGPLDARVDIYSLGCVLYECLSGRVPFDRPSMESTIKAHLMDEPPLISARHDNVPAAFDEVIAKGMAKSPNDRYESCGELIEAAAEALTTAVATPHHERHRSSTVIAASTGPSEAPPPSEAQPRREASPRRAPPSEARPPRGGNRFPLVSLLVGLLAVVTAAFIGVRILASDNESAGSPSSAPGTGQGSDSVGGKGTVGLSGLTGQLGTLVFTSDRDGDNDIYVMDSTGSRVRPLTRNDEDDHKPAWSPDGSQIAFASDRDGDFEIYTADRDGRNVRQLTVNEDVDDRPTWSPDGKKIIFTSARQGQTDLFVLDIATKIETQLTEDSAEEFRATWSPDCKQIAFNSDLGECCEIYLMNEDGSIDQLTHNQVDDGEPVWSPDGDRIAFTSLRGGNENIYLISPDGRAERLLTRSAANERQPGWSSDGARLVFTSDRAGQFDLYSMNPEGADVRRLTSDPGRDFEASWPLGNSAVKCPPF
jgi:Tol biopolymer transport system component/serine/threonine protein kinase